jgi:hypothetical protein
MRAEPQHLFESRQLDEDGCSPIDFPSPGADGGMEWKSSGPEQAADASRCVCVCVCVCACFFERLWEQKVKIKSCLF